MKQSNWREPPAKGQHGARDLVSAAPLDQQDDKHETGDTGSL